MKPIPHGDRAATTPTSLAPTAWQLQATPLVARSERIKIDWRYIALTLTSLLAIYALSSRPGSSSEEEDPVMALLSNLGHIPLFAALAFFVLKSLTRGAGVSKRKCALAFAVTAAYAIVDEWHQSFVPGRQAAIGDFVMDLAGAGGILVALCFFSNQGPRSHRGEEP